MIVFMLALVVPYHHWTMNDNQIWFVVIYSLTFFFANFGPNGTTFVVPTEKIYSTLLGYWFIVAFIDRIVRFTIQLMGFFFMIVFMFALAIPYHHWNMTIKLGLLSYIH